MRNLMRVLFLGMVALLLAGAAALAQSAMTQENRSISVTTGNTYQAIAAVNQSRRMIQIQNNNTNTDNCFINDDGLVAAGNTTATSVTTANGAITAAKASILLQPGQAYTRYYPYVPSGPIVGTCASNGDSLYVGTF